MHVDLVDVNEVDFNEIHKLLAKAFEERDTSKTDIEIPSINSLKFKYQHSIVKSKLAIVFENNQMVAMNGLVPIEINALESREIGWMSCDSATHPEFRGKGLFKKCVQALEISLKQNSFMFGFPNSNSMPGFLKMGWINIAEIELYASVTAFRIPRIWNIKKIDLQDISTEFSKANFFAKTPTYLNWRYSSSVGDYSAYQINLSKGVALVITKKMKLNGVAFTLILDLMISPEEFNNELLQSIKHLAHLEGSIGILMSPSWMNKSDLIKNGFFKVPNFLNSRRIYFAGKQLNKIDKFKNEIYKFKFSLGDFDAI